MSVVVESSAGQFELIGISCVDCAWRSKGEGVDSSEKPIHSASGLLEL